MRLSESTPGERPRAGSPQNTPFVATTRALAFPYPAALRIVPRMLAQPESTRWAISRRNPHSQQERQRRIRLQGSIVSAVVDDLRTRVQRAIDLVEAQPFGSLSIEDLAAVTNWSPWHFHRTFTSLVGITPGRYMWLRRLAMICRRLVATAEPLVDVALDVGFESQAAFTRAFTREIGISPGRYRHGGTVAIAHDHPPIDVAAIPRPQGDTMEPHIVEMPTLQIVGLSGRFTPGSTLKIGALWERFAPRIDQVPHRRGQETYGVCLDPTSTPGGEMEFTYLAGVAVERLDLLPTGMVATSVAASRYAVFTHRGHISRIGVTLKAIWAEWLPASSVRPIAAADFEYYDHRFDPRTGDGEVDVYVPIASD